MKPSVNLILAIIILFSSSMLRAQTARTPIEFNDLLTAITDTLFARGQQWGRQFNVVTEARAKGTSKSTGYASLAPYRQAMELYLDGCISRLKSMPDVNDSKDLRMAMIAFLEYEKNMATLAFKPFESLKASATDEQLKAVYSKLSTYSAAEKEELLKVAEAQEAYARSNGFRIESRAKD